MKSSVRRIVKVTISSQKRCRSCATALKAVGSIGGINFPVTHKFVLN
nr:MAG TPA: hypothetical protein [Caudoviricetes sp.]